MTGKTTQRMREINLIRTSIESSLSAYNKSMETSTQSMTWISSPISVLKSDARLPDSKGFLSPSPEYRDAAQQKSDGWAVPVSTKSIRAINPVTFAFERLAKKVKLGAQRLDGKDPISLAVSKS